jgi:hypothetical protein
MPLELYRKSTGEELGKPVWMDQPAINQPRSVTIAYTVDSLLILRLGYMDCKISLSGRWQTSIL